MDMVDSLVDFVEVSQDLIHALEERDEKLHAVFSARMLKTCGPQLSSTQWQYKNEIHNENLVASVTHNDSSVVFHFRRGGTSVLSIECCPSGNAVASFSDQARQEICKYSIKVRGAYLNMHIFIV